MPLDIRTPSVRLARILEHVVPSYVFIDRHSFRRYQGCVFTVERIIQIKLRRYRIELGAIEHILSLFPIVKENVVIPIYENGQVGKLRLIYSGEGDCEKEIRKHLIKNLPSYMIPKSMIRVESLPKDQNNRIDRVIIKEMYGGNSQIPQR